ncbi:MAG TPA: triose-phosphate isomerase family protein, partial [Planctomycetota bacterium]|nr:triose-phosphate isomerase family protein [Planctomycetota bacterium]
MKRPFVAGNWKMNLDRRSCFELAERLRDALRDERAVELGVAVPYPYLELVAGTLRQTPVAVGAQDVCERKNGAFTGEVSAEMLLDVGCRFALVGHSERRHVYGEGDALCNAKVLRALEAGLAVVLCVGETLAERDAGRTEAVVRA